MLCKNFLARNFRRTPLKERSSNERARMQLTCHDFCSFLLPRFVLETLRGASASGEFPCRKIPPTDLAEPKFRQSNARPRLEKFQCDRSCQKKLPPLACPAFVLPGKNMTKKLLHKEVFHEACTEHLVGLFLSEASKLHLDVLTGRSLNNIWSISSAVPF